MKLNNRIKYFTIALAVLVCVGIFFAGRATVQEVEVIKYVEVVDNSIPLFDTSIVEANWCGDFSDGTVRMVGAWLYADGVVEDEQGQLWGINEQVSEEDFLLLWIADNGTPNNTLDDIVIKVWREAY